MTYWKAIKNIGNKNLTNSEQIDRNFALIIGNLIIVVGLLTIVIVLNIIRLVMK